MRRTVYNASFEESQNLVTEQYIRNCIDNSTRKVVRKRTIGIVFTLLLIMGVHKGLLLLQDYSKETPIGEVKVLSSKLGSFWYYAPLIIFIYYLCLRILEKSRVLLKHDIYYQVICMLVVILYLLLILGMLSLANVVVQGIWPSIVYGVFFSYIIYDQTKKYYRRVFDTIYQRKTEEKAWSFYARFLIFASKYGLIIVVLTGLLKNFNASHQKEYGASFLQQIAGLTGPLILIIGVIFFFYIAEVLLQGYYLRKYYEQYRLKYNGTTKQWYGEKSKQYKQAQANGKEA